jgi:cytochrome c oxidase cbb3-type subunit 3
MSDTNQTPNAGGDDRRDVPIAGHNYDGIREYDNPMPGWWVWLFWASVAVAPFYALGVHVFGYFDTYEEDLAEGQAALMDVRHAYAEANPTFQVDEETLASFVENPAMAEAGAAHYAAQCAACHGPQGQGLIGPNMTDDYWLHGGTNVDQVENSNCPCRSLQSMPTANWISRRSKNQKPRPRRRATQSISIRPL